MIPKDPVMLLSYVNTQLRDNYASLDEFCGAMDVEKEELLSAKRREYQSPGRISPAPPWIIREWEPELKNVHLYLFVYKGMICCETCIK